MDISELDYELPPELIAQDPAERRDASRLLVYERGTSAVRHRTFDELPEELQGELVVVNDTKVVPARIPIESPRGELLLLERLDDGTWEALARPTRRLRPGRRYGPAELLEHLGRPVPATGPQPPRRARERLPRPVVEPLEQEQLAARRFDGDPRRHDLRVVHDDELPLQLLRQLVERPVPDGTGPAFVDEQPRRVTPFRRILRDQLRRQLI